MSDVTTSDSVASRDVAKVIAECGPLPEGQFAGVLMERFDCLSTEALSHIRQAMMDGRIYRDDDGRYCRTGYWNEPGWEPDDQ